MRDFKRRLVEAELYNKEIAALACFQDERNCCITRKREDKYGVDTLIRKIEAKG